ncbi:MAG: 16S rRNA (cytidine(1402)-2'-O)-methyltransferase [Comamonas sp.]
MSASFSSALPAAQAAAGNQQYPASCLYVVATPIGNLADITLRALHVLEIADAVACEDTRHTHSMLRAYGIGKSGGQLIAVHQHNEAEAAEQVIARLQQGQRIAYVSDAGTPGVSDPGARLAAAVARAGLRVSPLPGASSVTTLLSAAGAVAVDETSSGFAFIGFLPTKTQERQQAVAQLAQDPRTLIVLEAPHRIADLAKALASLGDRLVTMGRELTKQFEDIATMPASELPGWLAQDTNRSRGEFAVLLHPQVVQSNGNADAERVLALLLAELPTKTAVKLAADITGAPRNALYDTALAMKRGAEPEESE